MVSVELRGLMRRFRDGTSIGPIDLSINDGELMTLLGPSGSGKTTTLRMMAGFFSPQAGNLLFDGQDVTYTPPRDRNIGMVFQSVALFPNMSVYQNIAFALEMAGWAREATIDRVEYLADLLGIRGLLMRRSNEVSGGEGQRIALARALAKEPNLLLLDEPLSALDPQLRERLQAEIRRIQDELDITTIYVTHSQDEAFAISNRVAILNDGVVNQVGHPEELYDRPANEFVASFLGSGNVLTGLVVEHQQEQATVETNGYRFIARGSADEGRTVKYTVKPEDIILTLDESEGFPSASVISVVPRIGTFRITIDFHGQIIVASAPDESLAHKLRSMKDAEVGFKFTDGSVMLLD
ncbi:MAG: ABC transporter ATP-binding protein [Candidatus Thorarchaeota archaeon]|jgi:ABC-type Fe3+/spermidine/putrescine transport system ATPase subunit